jgi:DNA gyrase subunit A
MATRSGRVKRTRVDDLSATAGHWSRVIGFADENDRVLFADVGGDDADIVFVTADAQVLRTSAGAVNPQASGTAKGVAGISLRSGDRLLTGALVPKAERDRASVFIVSAHGWCKRVPIREIPSKGRATKGVKGLNVTDATGPVAGAAVGPSEAGLDVVFDGGRRHHVPSERVPEENRYNRGKRLVDMEAAGADVDTVVAL